MKKYNRILVVCTLLVCFTVSKAQDKYNPWSISLGVNAVDYYPVGQPDPQGDLFDEYFNVNDHWNIFPMISRFSVSRYWTSGISFSVIGSFNEINKIGSNVNSSTGEETTNRVDDFSFLSLDGAINYSFMNLINSNKIDPYLSGGAGYTWLDGAIGSGTVNASLGLRYWFSEKFALDFQSTYKHVVTTIGLEYLQHSASVTYKFGGTDTDRDGIYDNEDDCPEVPGLAAFNGCPDSDNDGIKDSEDDCPNVAGLSSLNGCPDADRDGVSDKDDKCPNTPGISSLAGCPDTDEDGIIDKIDKCPDARGPSQNGGCPWPDSDGDGILDKDDKCPNIVGTIANGGCKKEITQQERNLLNKYASTILFSTGNSIIQKDSESVLTNIIKILENNPDAKFSIEGHTDSIGSELLNLRLSETRASAVKDYLIANGVNQFRLSSQGFGESKPIAPNTNENGRSQNRRVEINLVN